MNPLFHPMFALWLSLGPSPAAKAPLEVRAYDRRTFLLRESLASTSEAPFMYLLIGSKRALLIDTGDVADPKAMPLASTVMGLLPGEGPSKLPLLVVHSHGHLDHRLGDAQFAGSPTVQVIPSDLEHVRTSFGFPLWPEGTATVDLGDRIVEVLPAPGHHPAHVVYYDRGTGLLFTGDFLLPGRLLVNDLGAYKASAERVARFVRDKPVTSVLGGHVEKNRRGELFPWQASDHPEEGPLALTKADVMQLPSALVAFNGFYTETGDFVIANPLRNLTLGAGLALLILVGAGVALFRFFRRRRKKVRAAGSHGPS